MISRVYTVGRQSRTAHLLDIRDSPDTGAPALCGQLPSHGVWRGVASAAEHEEAARRPTCITCLRIGADVGYLDSTGPAEGLTVATPLGYVDLVAVDRVMRGRRCKLTRAETAYLLRLLADDLARHPAPGMTGKLGGLSFIDPRFLNAADGLGVSPKSFASRVYRTNRQLEERRAKHGPTDDRP